MEEHNHVGPWWGIALAIIVVLIFSYVTFLVENHQFRVIYERVGDIQRQLECQPTETLVTDHEGDEYCVDVAERPDGP